MFVRIGLFKIVLRHGKSAHVIRHRLGPTGGDLQHGRSHRACLNCAVSKNEMKRLRVSEKSVESR